MHQDHETPRRRKEFSLGYATENQRVRKRFWTWIAILVIGTATVIIGTAKVWL